MSSGPDCTLTYSLIHSLTRIQWPLVRVAIDANGAAIEREKKGKRVRRKRGTVK